LVCPKHGQWLPFLFSATDDSVLSPLYQGALHFVSIQLILQLMLTTPVQFIVGSRFYAGAWNALKHRGTNMVHTLSS